jgi:hypothetical protein
MGEPLPGSLLFPASLLDTSPSIAVAPPRDPRRGPVLMRPVLMRPVLMRPVLLATVPNTHGLTEHCEHSPLDGRAGGAANGDVRLLAALPPSPSHHYPRSTIRVPFAPTATAIRCASPDCPLPVPRARVPRRPQAHAGI